MLSLSLSTLPLTLVLTWKATMRRMRMRKATVEYTGISHTLAYLESYTSTWPGLGLGSGLGFGLGLGLGLGFGFWFGFGFGLGFGLGLG